MKHLTTLGAIMLLFASVFCQARAAEMKTAPSPNSQLNHYLQKQVLRSPALNDRLKSMGESVHSFLKSSGPSALSESHTRKAINYDGGLPLGSKESNFAACNCLLDPVFDVDIDLERCIVRFTGNGNADPCWINVTYNWDFGDGTTGTGQSVNHQYTTPGSYEVCLTVTADNGIPEQRICQKTICKRISVRCTPPPCDCKIDPDFSFQFDPERCVLSLTAAGYVNPCLNNVTYTWNFGDGTTGTGANIEHAYATPGSYEVCLTISANNGSQTSERCSKKICKKIDIRCTPKPCECKIDPKFESHFNEEKCILELKAVGFVNPCLLNVTYTWSFGDGTTATGQYVEHAYATPGSYEVCLTISADNGSQTSERCSKKYCEKIDIKCTPKPCECKIEPRFDYQFDPERCLLSLTSVGEINPCLKNVTYTWSFGDGTTGTGAFVQHTYATSGSYEVCLIISADNGIERCEQKFCKIIEIRCATQPCDCKIDPRFDYQFNPERCLLSLASTGFVNPCLNNVTYTWDFGDGTTGTGAFVQHTYATSGSYLVCLTVSADNGIERCEKRYCQVIDIRCATQPCDCKIEPKYEYQFNPERCILTLTSTGFVNPCLNNVTYTWDFGDGTTGTGANIQHIYAASGSYIVCLTVSADNGIERCEKRYCQVIDIRCATQPCDCKIEPRYDYQFDPERCILSLTSVGYVNPCLRNVTYTWTFGDGTTGTGASVQHAYAASGSYEVCLIISADNGIERCEQKFCKIIEIRCATQPCECKIDPRFDYQFNPERCLLSLASTGFVNPCLNNVTYTWDFGDGTTGTGAFVQHVYGASGSYLVCLTVSADNGIERCQKKYCQIVDIRCDIQPCECKIDPRFDYQFDPERCILSLTSVGYVNPCLRNVTYTWTFGDGTTGTGASVQHAYAAPGSYEVCLIISADNGIERCQQKFCKIIEIRCATQPCDCKIKPDFNFELNQERCFVRFTSSGYVNPCLNNVTYTWSFGDGTTATGASVDHAYATPGSYDVCLTVTADNGVQICTEKICKKVETRCTPVGCDCDALKPKYSYELNRETCLYTFFGTSGSPACENVVEYFWDFGDGTTSIGQNVGHVYAATGIYRVCLIVILRDKDGKVICTKRYCEEIRVECKSGCECKLKPSFQMIVNGSCDFTFVGASGSPCANIKSYEWYVNGSGPYSGQFFHQQFDVNTTYEICVVVTAYTDQGECKAKYCETFFFTDCYRFFKNEATTDAAAATGIELYPNPANQQVAVKFTPKERSEVNILLRSADGKLIGTYSEWHEAGNQTMSLDIPDSVANGLIFVEISIGESRFVERLMIMRK